MSKYSSLKDHVYQYISKKIQNGELLPNHKISENEICSELGISRTPAREALIQLSSENLIDYIPRKGFMVKEIDTKRKLDLYVIIGYLDGLAASLSLEHVSDEDILKMEELIEKCDIAIKYKNYPDYQKYQNEFHDIYISKCDNEPLQELLSSLKNNFIRQSYLSEDKEKLFAVLAQGNIEHKELIESFKSKNKEKIEDMLKKHWYTVYVDMI